MKIVYFLGAGFSRNFGYPLTGDIMAEVITSLRRNDLFELNEGVKSRLERLHEKSLLDFIYKLYPGLNKKELALTQVPSITEVLSMVDHFCLYNLPPHPDLDENNLQLFRQLLNRAVGELLLTYDLKSYTKDEKKSLNTFMTPLKQLKQNHKVSIITTNYDLIIDSEFKSALINKKVDFGIAHRDIEDGNLISQPSDPLFSYYKLHGSLNWLRCDLCGQYYVNPYGSIIHNAFREEIDENNTCDCNSKIKLKPVLVAPSLVRDIRDPNLLQIWKSAMEVIRTADKLVFIGYSLPPEDFAIKSVIMRGINGRSSKKGPLEVHVVQKSEKSKPNYVNLFTDNITYYNNGLSEYLNSNQQEYN